MRFYASVNPPTPGAPIPVLYIESDSEEAAREYAIRTIGKEGLNFFRVDDPDAEVRTTNGRAEYRERGHDRWLTNKWKPL